MAHLTIKSPRAAIESEIERLIGLLDAIDGDPDLEPSLGSTACAKFITAGTGALEICNQSLWAQSGTRDLELDDSDYEHCARNLPVSLKEAGTPNVSNRFASCAR